MKRARQFQHNLADNEVLTGIGFDFSLLYASTTTADKMVDLLVTASGDKAYTHLKELRTKYAKTAIIWSTESEPLKGI